MGIKSAVAGSLIAVILATGCAASTAEVCATQALVYDGEAVASFDTTIGAVRSLPPTLAEPPRWAELPESHPAILCYIDTRVPKAPPGLEPFDRAVVAVVDGQAELVAAGYRDRLEVPAP